MAPRKPKLPSPHHPHSPKPEPKVWSRSELLPKIEAHGGMGYAGAVGRGHRIILPEYRGKGFFSKALEFLEAHERRVFSEGGFNSYRNALILELGAFYRKDPEALRKPMHIDFTRYYYIGSIFLKKGYVPIPASLRILEHEGLKPDPSLAEVQAFLETSPKKELSKFMPLVFVKKPSAQ